MKTEIKIEYWPNGNLAYEYSYFNGIQHDIQKWYYDNGQLGYQYHMKDGQFHGMDQNWHRDERNYIRQWKNNQLNGPKIRFNHK
jgi:antitoxin component YwqK of YwqJK toxin-antitoxin module